jgi:hypothetical protein
VNRKRNPATRGEYGGAKVLKMTPSYYESGLGSMPVSQHCHELPNQSYLRTLLFRLSLMRQKRGSNIMTDSVTALYDEEIPSFDVPDAALELAGSKLWEGPASSFTVSFCSGIDTCPSYPL